MEIGWKWVKRPGKAQGTAELQSDSSGMAGEAIVKSRRAGQQPLRILRGRPLSAMKEFILQAVIASPDSACCADLEAGPHPQGRNQRR